MLTRSMWLALTGQSSKGSKVPLPEGICDSQPLAWESMDHVVFIPQLVRIYSGTSPIHGPPCQHHLCKAPTLAITSRALLCARIASRPPAVSPAMQ